MDFFLKQLTLTDFKNYSSARIEFCPGVNCLLGNNGSGKTNILDAIHYLSHTKSYFNSLDSENIRHEAPFFLAEGLYERDGHGEILQLGVKRGEKKTLRRNRKEYARLADHIGLFPLVIVSPQDADLVREGSEVRRRFPDRVISQFDKAYLDDLMAYNRMVLQRNNLLKYFAKNKTFDSDALEAWNQQLIPLGQRIHLKRQTFVTEFVSVFDSLYGQLSGGREHVALRYESQLSHADFERLLEESLPKDRLLERTSVGIHKDDLQFEINSYPLKRFGSQGQQKSFLIALKLAEFLYVKERLGITPLLLLDDVFDKIDDQRVAQLMEMVSGGEFGQTFITDTHLSRVPELFARVGSEMKVFRVENAQITEMEYEPER